MVDSNAIQSQSGLNPTLADVTGISQDYFGLVRDRGDRHFIYIRCSLDDLETWCRSRRHRNLVRSVPNELVSWLSSFSVEFIGTSQDSLAFFSIIRGSDNSSCHPLQINHILIAFWSDCDPISHYWVWITWQVTDTSLSSLYWRFSKYSYGILRDPPTFFFLKRIESLAATTARDFCSFC